MSHRPNNELFRQLTRISHEVALGNYDNVGAIFELTKETEYPPEIVEMAESFGMMIVRIDAKQQHLERLIVDLNERQLVLEQLTASLKDANTGILEALGSAIAKRDSDTHAHNYRVTLLAIHLGRTLNLEVSALQGLVKGSFLHDLGKIAISDTILLKPGKLSDDEFRVMKSHVIHGSDIIRSYPWLGDAYDVVHHHHEKFDGQGYPDQLSGTEIPLNARIFAVADVFDALVSVRPYKKAFSFDMAMCEMSRARGSHFDPDILDVFAKIAAGLYGEVYGLNERELATLLRKRMQDCFLDD
jgi:HD-GYP domain-containing protein (c-di-GMP phosphodiesterase class II)